jgi:hypothetical protein
MATSCGWELRGNVDRALEWLDRWGDRDGYLAYQGESDSGLANQGWKDSGDAIVNADGSLAEPPIKLVEVQGYAYLARVGMADLFEYSGDGDGPGVSGSRLWLCASGSTATSGSPTSSSTPWSCSGATGPRP